MKPINNIEEKCLRPDVDKRPGRRAKMKKLIYFVVVGIIILSLVSLYCSKSTSSKKDGYLKLYLTDTPTDFDEVNIVVSEIWIHAASDDTLANWIMLDSTEATYDLLELRNGVLALMDSSQLPAGHYTQLRLKVTDGSNVVVNGDSFGLEIPSGYTSGIKLNHQFTIEEGRIYELTLDFDAEKSIIQKGNGEYQLKPVIRVIAQATSGEIEGTTEPKPAQAFAIADTDTAAQTSTDTTGYFKLIGLGAGLYDVTIVPEDALYADTTIADVEVVAGSTTNLGLIQLRLK